MTEKLRTVWVVRHPDISSPVYLTQSPGSCAGLPEMLSYAYHSLYVGTQSPLFGDVTFLVHVPDLRRSLGYVDWSRLATATEELDASEYPTPDDVRN